MDHPIPARLRRRAALALRATAAATLLAACSADEILDVTDPDIVDPTTLENASGAQSQRAGVSRRLAQMTTGGESMVLLGGLLTDEWRSGDTFEQRNTTDQRTLIPQNSFLAPPLRSAQRVRTEARATIAGLREFQPQPAVYQGQMFAFSAFAANMLAEHYCNGIPLLSGIEGTDPIAGRPLTVDSVFALAAADADSALANSGPATPAAADSTRLVTLYRNFARVVKARALVNRGQYAAAALVTPTVPSTFTFQVSHSVNTTDNQNWSLNTNAKRYTIANREGGNGQPWISAGDPRVRVTVPTGTAGISFDNETPFANQTLWTRFDPVTIVSGVEARLIEAEAALAANDLPTFVARLNAARGTRPAADRTALPDFTLATIPATPAGRVDLLFRERAFFFFGTGHRLGDMRRLVRQYGRNSETVFPTGAYHKGGGQYGPRVNLPIPFDETNNPEFRDAVPAGSTCLDDKA